MEFALLLPVFMMLVLGMFSGGQAYNRQLDMTHASREGARWASTVPADQTFTNTLAWDVNVRQVVIDRSAGELEAGDICVSLVEGSPATVIAAPAGHNQNEYSTNGTAPCDAAETYPVAGSDNGRRVQVRTTHPAEIELLFTDININLKAEATVRAETS